MNSPIARRLSSAALSAQRFASAERSGWPTSRCVGVASDAVSWDGTGSTGPASVACSGGRNVSRSEAFCSIARSFLSINSSWPRSVPASLASADIRSSATARSRSDGKPVVQAGDVILKVDVRSFYSSYSQFLIANEVNVADLADAERRFKQLVLHSRSVDGPLPPRLNAAQCRIQPCSIVRSCSRRQGFAAPGFARPGRRPQDSPRRTQPTRISKEAKTAQTHKAKG